MFFPGWSPGEVGIWNVSEDSVTPVWPGTEIERGPEGARGQEHGAAQPQLYSLVAGMLGWGCPC